MATIAIATPTQRRALRTKLLCFYGKYEPEKSIKDVNDLVDWAIANGVDTLNEKLKHKYNDDLHSIKPSSTSELSLITQLRLFYGEFDAGRPMAEIHKVEQWVGIHGIVALNERMLERYGENLNSLCFGGRDHLFDLLTAFYKKHDPSKSSPEHVQTIRDWTLYYGPVKLNEKLVYKYGDGLHLSVEDIENSLGHDHHHHASSSSGGQQYHHHHQQSSGGRSRAESELPTPDAWAETMANKPPANHSRISLQSISSNMTTYVEGSSSASTLTHDPMIDMIHLQRLVELFYARNAPQKLVESIVDKIIQWTRHHSIEDLNKKLRATYHTDLEDLEKEYFALYDELELFYAKHDPKKLDVGGGLDDIVGWGLVHGVKPLSDRLEAKYGEGVNNKGSIDVAKLRTELNQFYATFEPNKSKEDIDTIISWVLSNSREALCTKLKAKFGVDLDDYKTKPALLTQKPASAVSASSSASANSDASTNAFSTQSGNDTIRDHSVIISNELPAALGGTTSRLSNLGMGHKLHEVIPEVIPSPQPLGLASPPRAFRGSVTSRPPVGAPPVIVVSTPPNAKPASTAAAATGPPAVANPAPSTPPAPPATTVTPPATPPPRNESKSDAASDKDEDIEQEMGRMQQVVSGKFTHLGLKLEAFYKKYDQSKANNKEALDLILKWALKHGVEELNTRLKEKWGEDLNDIKINDNAKPSNANEDPEPVF